jgi:hypothetical protein
VIQSLNQEQLADLLEFATGCPLPPLNGFTGENKNDSWFRIEVDPLRFNLYPTEPPKVVVEESVTTPPPQLVNTNLTAEEEIMEIEHGSSSITTSSTTTTTTTTSPRGAVVINLPRRPRTEVPQGTTTTASHRAESRAESVSTNGDSRGPTRQIASLIGITDPLEVAAIVAQLAAQNQGVLPSTIDGRPFTDVERLRINYLPGSQTCFKQLILGLYDSEEQLREKILYAITNTKTMENK